MSSSPVFYAVAVGKIPGVYQTWEETQTQIHGVENARYKKFAKEEDAWNFIKAGGSSILSQLHIEVDVPVPIVNVNTETCQNTHNADDLVVFTDGSALGNGKMHAKAGYAMVWPNQRHLTQAKPLEGPNKTNNRAEFMACIEALEMADRIDPSRTKPMYIYTDSMLLINTATKWLKSWKRNGWKKSTGDPVLNLDLIQRLDALLLLRKIVWKHVKAHTDKKDWASHWNRVADMMAKEAAQ